MLKRILMASAMIVATPVLALDMPQGGQGDRGASKTSAAGEVTPSVATPGAPKATPPVQARSDGAAPSATPSQPVKTADGTPQTPAPQVRAIVGREFAAYDSDGSGSLDKAEFAAWMAALQARSPTADAPTKPWTAAAFKQADADSSETVTKEELAGFFTGAKTASAG